jgi:hypothetical protein
MAPYTEANEGRVSSRPLSTLKPSMIEARLDGRVGTTDGPNTSTPWNL